MYDDVMTRNDDNELAVRTVSSSGDNGVNPNDVFTRDDEGRLCMRIVGGSGGGGSVDKNKIINKSATLPTPSANNLGQAYMYDGQTDATYTHGYIYQVVAEQTVTEVEFSGNIISSWAVADFVRYLQEGGASYNEVVRGTLTYDESGGLWDLVGYDANGNEVLKFHEYTEDLVDFGCVFASETHQDGENCTFTLTTTASGYKWKRVDVQPAGGTGNVSSVNGKTGAVVLNAKDVNAIPQYDVLPEAGVDNLGEIAQYVGNTGYQNGYMYKSSEVYSAPQATISQTVGSSLSDLAVDVNVFVEEEQPTQSGMINFVASVAERGVVFTTVTGDFTIEMSPANFYQFMLDNAHDLDGDTDVRNGVIGFGGPIGSDAYVGPNNSSVWFFVQDSSVLVNTYGAVITGEITAGDYVAYTWNVGGETEWNKNGTAVDLGDYGISYNGTPENGDTLSVEYIAPEVIGYEWKPAEVMPATTITITMEG